MRMTSDEEIRPRTLGIVGGMGPLASAEFLKTLYEATLTGREQSAPRVLLDSDPSIPDRTQALLSGREAALIGLLIKKIEGLREIGADHILICCMTTHCLLPNIPLALRECVVSLIDTTVDALLRRGGRHLMCCTIGSRAAGSFEGNERWALVKNHVIWPNEEDQELVHRQIYSIKANRPIESIEAVMRGLLNRYEVNSFISGCTELHLLTRHFLRIGTSTVSFVDPLFEVTNDLYRSNPLTRSG